MNQEPNRCTYIYLQYYKIGNITVITDKLYMHDRYALHFKVSQYNLQNPKLAQHHSENISF